jgi:tetratricopeptide (TPR) repeat protein
MGAASRVCNSCATPVPADAAFCPTCGAATPTDLNTVFGEGFEDRLRVALRDRYRIEREVGQGGMAVVFLAHDLKHDRDVALKVMRPGLAASVGAARFLHEIKLAAKLTHQNILALYDSGDADGFLYYVMPYVDGESLRQKLNRERQLPIDEALRLTREIAEGLEYAHEQRVIHRDIKPENILLSRGHALIADFGIAKAAAQPGTAHLTSTGTSVGTPLYMSPEQAAGDPDIDHRSDLYSLGCMLYEMLAGEPPFTGPTAQAILAKRLSDPVPRVSVLRSSVSAPVEEALTKALAVTPADRFATARDMVDALARPGASDLTPGKPRRRILARRVIGLVALAVAVGLGLAVGVPVLWSSGIDFAERDWIVLTDVENQTGDPVFGATLSSALLVGLQQSRYVNVLPRTRVSEVLTRMERPDTVPVDEVTGREVALRANARLVVVPAIGRIDSTYLLTTRIVDPGTGQDLLARSRRVEGRGQVLEALDGLVRQLRRDLGESRRALAQDGVPLDLATTPSLEALRAWTEGNQLWNHRRLDDAAERWAYALSLDSNFAMAHKTLGGYFAWLSNRDSSEYHFAKALARLDRVTEGERFLIESAAAASRQDWSTSIRALETFVERYPDNLSQRYNLGSTYWRANRVDDAIRTLSEVVAIDSTHVGAYINMASAYAEKGDAANAIPLYRRAFALRPDLFLATNLNHEYGFTLVGAGRLDSAEATFRAMLSEAPMQQAQGHRSLALLRMYQGRYADARAHLEQAIVRNRTTGWSDSEFRNHLYLAATYRSANSLRALRSEIRHARAIVDTTRLAAPWLRLLVPFYLVLGDTAGADDVLRLMKERGVAANATDQTYIRGVEAQLALARGHDAEAIPVLQELTAAGPPAVRAEYRAVLASAYRRAGDRERAVATYLEVIADRLALGWEAQEPWILAHRELARLYEAQADTARAVEFYQRFLDIWKDGDADLTALADARGRVRALSEPTNADGAR